MTLAQIPAADSGDVMKWLLGFAAMMAVIGIVLGVVNQLRQLVAPKAKPRRDKGDRIVRRAEFEEWAARMELRMDRHEAATAVRNDNIDLKLDQHTRMLYALGAKAGVNFRDE